MTLELKYQDFFTSQGLNVPYIPLKSTLKMQEESVFGTIEPPSSLYDIEYYINDYLTNHSKDYVLCGISGYGSESVAMHYLAVKGPIGLFIQLNYGSGAHESGQALRDRINGIFGAIEMLFEALENSPHVSKKRLLIVESDFYGSGWGWVDGADKLIWHEETEGATALFSALEEILSK